MTKGAFQGLMFELWHPGRDARMCCWKIISVLLQQEEEGLSKDWA